MNSLIPSIIGRVACIQCNTHHHLEQEIAKRTEQIKQAAANGATFITLPENAVFMGKNTEELHTHSFGQKQHPALHTFCHLAKSLGVWILVGSLSIRLPRTHKLANRSFLINSEGQIVTHYTKIHLYDAALKAGESHQESKHFTSGKTAPVVQTPFGKLGMTICYDVRFPHLFRRLAQKGAEIITVPAAFTAYTGKAHWEVLLRARAIETGSYIIAPAQVGTHPSGRKTYGHSLIIDPWGSILVDAGTEEGIIMADIDLQYVAALREQLPSLHAERLFSIKTI